MQFLDEVLLWHKESWYENSIKNGMLNKATNKNNDKYLIKQSSGQTLVWEPWFLSTLLVATSKNTDLHALHLQVPLCISHKCRPFPNTRKLVFTASVQFPGPKGNQIPVTEEPQKLSLSLRLPQTQHKVVRDWSLLKAIADFLSRRVKSTTPRGKRKSRFSSRHTNVGKGREDSPALVGSKGEKYQA